MRLEPEQHTFLEACRRAVLATVRSDGRARLVPVCFAAVTSPAGDVIYTPLDEKPKRVADVRDLARVRDVAARADVTLLFDRWEEDWTRLGWLRIDGLARIVEPEQAGHDLAVRALRLRYPQYVSHDLERLPLIAITPVRVAAWGRLA